MVKVNKAGVGAIISILIPALLTILIINFVYEIIPTVLEGLPIFLPLLFCPIGIILAVLAYKTDKRKLSKVGIVLNAVLFFSPFIWMIGGTIFFGP